MNRRITFIGAVLDYFAWLTPVAVFTAPMHTYYDPFHPF